MKSIFTGEKPKLLQNQCFHGIPYEQPKKEEYPVYSKFLQYDLIMYHPEALSPLKLSY